MVKNIPVGLVALFLSVPVSAVKLWATSYNDHAVTTLDFSGGNLEVVDKNYDCGDQAEPTWLTLDKANSLLYCLNEGWGGAASLTSYQVNADDTISTLDILPVLKSPVAASVYGPNNAGLAVAHYDTSAFTTYDVSDATNLTLAKEEIYTLETPGPNEGRQSEPHLHHTVVDPTGQFILTPDLGADLVRIYKVGSGIETEQLAPGVATPGSGPRHGAWVKQSGSNYFYTLNELTNTITGYKAQYSRGGLTLTKFTDIPAQPSGSIPDDTSAAELVASPDGKYIIASLRQEKSLTIPAFDGEGEIPSDPLITYKVGKNGKLSHVQTAPAGGVNPRGFSLNEDGSLLAAGLQDDNRVVIIERDVKTGKLGDFVGHATVGEGDGNGPNYVLFA